MNMRQMCGARGVLEQDSHQDSIKHADCPAFFCLFFQKYHSNILPQMPWRWRRTAQRDFIFSGCKTVNPSVDETRLSAALMRADAEAELASHPAAQTAASPSDVLLRKNCKCIRSNWKCRMRLSRSASSWNHAIGNDGINGAGDPWNGVDRSAAHTRHDRAATGGRADPLEDAPQVDRITRTCNREYIPSRAPRLNRSPARRRIEAQGAHSPSRDTCPQHAPADRLPESGPGYHRSGIRRLFAGFPQKSRAKYTPEAARRPSSPRPSHAKTVLSAGAGPSRRTLIRRPATS